MKDHVLRTTLHLAVPKDRVFAFFADATNLARITPPDVSFRIRTPLPITFQVGTLIDYSIGIHGVPMRWRTRIASWRPGEEFVDEQLRGPYARWVHRHTFRDDGAGGTVIDDEVQYCLPLGRLGNLAHPLVRRQLRHIFAYRTVVVQRLLGDGAGPATEELPRFE